MKSEPWTFWIFAVVLLVSIVTYAGEEVGNISDPRTAEAGKIMLNFARRTGLDSDHAAVRYLWTDAFAVCNFLGLARATGEERYRDLALKLVDQVHHILGRYRDDDQRNGWISGLNEEQGAAHPTRGGLRIGKKLPERGPDEPYDERMEWDRDGQYFHYLVKWMHALDQVSGATGDPKYNFWARELAIAAYDGFTYQYAPGRTPRMYWKMSTDLTRPLVTSMGQHDPLEGYLTAVQLRTSAGAMPQPVTEPNLEDIIRQFADMTAASELASPDPLGVGGLLVDAYRVMQLNIQGGLSDEDLLNNLLAAALAGLNYYARSGELQAPAGHRLAFRELGLAIGLAAVERMDMDLGQNHPSVRSSIQEQIKDMQHYVHLGAEIESFWRAPGNQDNSTWSEHRDINEVMLATRLVPDGFLVIWSIK